MMLTRRRILKIGALAAPFIITGRSAAWIHGSTPAAPASLLTINLVPDPNGSINSAPASFVTAAQQAATMIQNACPNTAVTLNIVYGYGSVFGSSIPSANAASATLNTGANIAYTTIRTQYIAKATTSAMIGVANNLPNTSTLGGFSTFQVPRAQQKALGIIGAVDSTQDGYIVIGTAIPSGNLVGVILHELGQAMGRLAGDAPFNFSAFTAVGTRQLTASSGVSNYFSIDNGVSKLADYDTGSTGDLGDFLNGPDGNGIQDQGQTNDDAFDAYYITSPPNKQFLSTVDIQNLNAMGFQ